VVVVGCGLLLTLARSPAPANKPAPDFLLPDLQGQVVRLSQLKGKVVLLNFWTTWCSQDVDGQSTVLPYLQEGGLTFPVLLDVRGEVGKKYGVTGYPETFIIDRQGNMVYHHIGYNDWSQPAMESALRRLIDQGVWTIGADGKTPGEQTPLRQ
jgi:peroxiredoxin